MKPLAVSLFAIVLAALPAPGTAQHILPPGTYFNNWGAMFSPNRSYFLQREEFYTMPAQLNLRRQDGSVRWSTRAPAQDVYMQTDGNFVTYAFGKPTWHTGTYGNPGAYLAVQDDGNLVVYSATGRPLWNIGADFYGRENPREVGDIVGRELNIYGVGWVGHLGIWDGREVAEVLGDRANAAGFTPLQDFRLAAQYWGAVNMPIPNGRMNEHCFRTYCDPRNDRHWERVETRVTAAKRAREIQAIGADYTIFPDNTRKAAHATPAYGGHRGLYRSDTYVLDLLDMTTTYTQPTSQQKRWKDFLRSLSAPPLVPRTIHERAASYR